ncbi:hypothetical protein EAF00_010910 [Botryotinia globosa]|nr:hypothetical protein EAF00_010910 [Botryotinia globosa]
MNAIMSFRGGLVLVLFAQNTSRAPSISCTRDSFVEGSLEKHNTSIRAEVLEFCAPIYLGIREISTSGGSLIIGFEGADEIE